MGLLLLMGTMLKKMMKKVYSLAGCIALLRQLAFLCKGWIGDHSMHYLILFEIVHESLEFTSHLISFSLLSGATRRCHRLFLSFFTSMRMIWSLATLFGVSTRSKPAKSGARVAGVWLSRIRPSVQTANIENTCINYLLRVNMHLNVVIPMKKKKHD